jgi:chromate reductase, NAD(P)H dehydrogenase (quinone)
MSSHVRILGIAGSLRRGSYNQAALRAAKLLVPENGEIDIFQLDGIPMFNEDDEKRPPSSVVELKKRIRSADAVLIVTPEYNYSVPGVLKNAIDCLSAPWGQRLVWKISGDHGCVSRRNRNRSGSTPSAADLCNSQLVYP